MTTEARLTHADIAERLRLPLSTVVELRKREGWPHLRFGKAVRFTEAMVAEIVASHVVTERRNEPEMFPGHRPRKAS